MLTNHKTHFSWPSPEELLQLYPAPPEALAIAAGTDVEAEAPLIWATVRMICRARTVRILELGTRQAISTRIIADAMNGVGQLVAVDPDPSCADWVSGRLSGLPPIPCTFLAISGEEAYARAWKGEFVFSRPDLVLLDTDPHSYGQTMMWLNTWIADNLAPGGMALLHDIIPARPEIQVREAVMEWLKTRDDFAWQEYRSGIQVQHGVYGLGCLWRRA